MKNGLEGQVGDEMQGDHKSPGEMIMTMMMTVTMMTVMGMGIMVLS